MNAEFDLTKPFELVLTDLDDRIESLRSAVETERLIQKHVLTQTRDLVAEMICSYFDTVRSAPAELYRVFVGDVLGRGDALITFNYDVALDRELARSGKWSPSNGYGFVTDGSFGNSSCRLFKLHGSTNWEGELFQGMTGFFQGSWTNLSLGRRPVIRQSELAHLGYENSADPEDHRGTVRVKALIMPTARKRFFKQTSLGLEWKDFWDCLWQQAEDAVKASNEVCLIGYSVPGYDTRARELFSKIDKMTSISVCCGSATDSVIDVLARLTRCHVQAAGAVYFEDWVQQATLSRAQ